MGPDGFVAIVLERPEYSALSLLGVLKAGGAYVALDPSHPRERMRVLMREPRVAVVLTEGDLADRLPDEALPVLRLDAGQDAIAAESDRRPGFPAHPRSLAYAVFTSGSTGLPKAVGLEHRSAVSRLRWSRTAYGRDALSGVLAGTSACFDWRAVRPLRPARRRRHRGRGRQPPRPPPEGPDEVGQVRLAGQPSVHSPLGFLSRPR